MTVGTSYLWAIGKTAPERTRPAPDTAIAPPTKLELSRAKRHAQNMASVFAAGKAAGAKLEFEQLDDAIRAVRTGFSGEGAFEGTTFQVPNIPDAQVPLAATQLRWNAEDSQLQYVPTELATAPMDAAKMRAAQREAMKAARPIIENKQRAARDPKGMGLAIARAEAVNIATFSFIQAKGKNAAIKQWADAKTADARYALLGPYLAFAPAELSDYMPKGYNVKLWTSLEKLDKVRLFEGEETRPY